MSRYLEWQTDPSMFQREREAYLEVIRRKYGAKGLEKYLAAEKEQKRCCKICKRKMILVSDHRPGTKRLRGLLCTWCNSILGNIERMPWVMDGIRGYLHG